MNLRSVRTLLVSAVCMLIACTTPTGACGCSPPMSTVRVRGTLSNAQGLALPDTPIILSIRDSLYPASFAYAFRSDATGSFFVTMISSGDGGTEKLYARVVAAPGDTVLVYSGTARFSLNPVKSDTVRLSLRLP